MKNRKILPPPKKGAKVLVFDIETRPLLSWTWGTHQQDIPLNMIKEDTRILSWSAKWLGSKASEVMYQDVRDIKGQDDGPILKDLWTLLNQAEATLTQNGRAFDHKRLNSRFILQGFPPIPNITKIDTLLIARKYFGFTSNKLEFLTKNLCTKYKKLVDKKFPGFTLWEQCMAGNKKAFEEMQRYNVLDCLSLEELYHKISPWDNTVNFSLYTDDTTTACNCGSSKFEKKGFAYTSTSKFQRYRCLDCGAQWKSNVNLLTKEKRKSLMKKL